MNASFEAQSTFADLLLWLKVVRLLKNISFQIILTGYYKKDV